MSSNVIFSGIKGEYAPELFLKLVADEAQQSAGKLVSSITLILTADSGISIHTSTTDRERNLSMIAVAHKHLINEMHEAYAHGFSREEDDGDPPPMLA